MKENQKNHSFWRVHLSTSLAVMLAAAVLLWTFIDCKPYITVSSNGNGAATIHRDFGWPMVALSQQTTVEGTRSQWISPDSNRLYQSFPSTEDNMEYGHNFESHASNILDMSNAKIIPLEIEIREEEPGVATHIVTTVMERLSLSASYKFDGVPGIFEMPTMVNSRGMIGCIASAFAILLTVASVSEFSIRRRTSIKQTSKSDGHCEVKAVVYGNSNT